MEGFHPMFNDACGCTCKAIVQIRDLQLPSVRVSVDGRMSTKKVLCRVVAKEFSKMC